MISKLRYGNTNTFFIQGISGGLLIDTDFAGTLSAFYKAIKEHSIKISDISYVLATHYHPDHIGLISELMKQGVKLLLLNIQKSYIHFSDEIFRRDKRLEYEPINTDNSVIINCKDSISLILDNGICFVGDLEPIEYLDAYDGNSKLKSDWNLVMSYNPKRIYYAHANEKIL